MGCTTMRRVGILLLTVSTLIATTGCAGQRLQEERDALFVQNQELEGQNRDLMAANDALETENERLRGRLTQRPEPQLQPQPQPAVGANTPFSGIAGVETEQTAGRVTVRVPGDVLFAPGKAELRSTSRETLQQIARVIQREYGDETIRVEGYTDTDPIRKSNWTDNLELSMHRAAAVERFLIEQGVDPHGAYSAGFGEANPRQTKEKSRRVEIVVVLNESR